MNQKIFFILCFIVSLTVSSQELMHIKNSKTYPATTSWDFISENYALTGITKIQIAKTEKGGILKIAIETTDTSFVISGIVYVYLADNTIISCSDKGSRETIGNQIISYYSFSPIEMNKLKTTDIESLHFNIKGNSKGFSSQIGNFTALNKKAYFSTAFDKTNKRFDTAKEIKSLYK